MNKKFRKLKLPSGTWRYRIGEHGVTTVLNPSGRRSVVSPSCTFTTCMCSCPPEFQCFGKGFSPGSLRRYIEENLL